MNHAGAFGGPRPHWIVDKPGGKGSFLTSLGLTLHPIRLAQSDEHGRFITPGYSIQWSCAPGCKVTDLCVGSEDASFPVQACFGMLEFQRLLERLRSMRLYGVEVPVWLRGRDSSGREVRSNSQILRAPVKPFSSPLTIREVEAEAMPYLTLEAGERDPDLDRVAPAYEFAGRLLCKEIDGYLYMLRGRRLCTYNKFRGFDCITFSAAMVGLHTNLAGQTATIVAEKIGAEKCGLEGVGKAQVRNALGPGKELWYPNGQYIAFHPEHTVLLGGGEVFEYSRSRKRFYRQTYYQWEGWAYNNGWIIRRIPENWRFTVD